MRLTISLIVTGITSVSSFVSHKAPNTFPTSFGRLTSNLGSTTESSSVPIVVTGNNVEVTPALMDYVNKKLERTIGKLSSSGAVMECDVHLSVNKNPKVS